MEASAKGTESENSMKGLFDDFDVNSKKLGGNVGKRNEKLVKLINSIGIFFVSANYKDNSIDLFGDERLMAMYAGNAGKSGGEFFTPQEVSELLVRIAVVGKTEINKVYDPACGSLLLKFTKVLEKQKVRKGFFGQEINITTYNRIKKPTWLLRCTRSPGWQWNGGDCFVSRRDVSRWRRAKNQKISG